MNAQRGSIFFYIFLGIALFAALSYVVAAMLRGGGDMGSRETAKLGAQRLIEYAQQAKIVVQQMKVDGISINDMSFLTPVDAGYTTAPHTAKIFHPNGGGLPMPSLTGLIDTSVTPPAVGKYVYMTHGAIGSVPTMLLGIGPLRRDVCVSVNQQYSGSSTIPTEADSFSDYFLSASSCCGVDYVTVPPPVGCFTDGTANVFYANVSNEH